MQFTYSYFSADVFFFFFCMLLSSAQTKETVVSNCKRGCLYSCLTPTQNRQNMPLMTFITPMIGLMNGCNGGVLVECIVRTEITLYSGVIRPSRDIHLSSQQKKMLTVFVGQVHIIVQFTQALSFFIL